MTDRQEENNDRWTCKHCYNTYSHNYKYKIHLEKCLVHCETVEQNNNIMLELKIELKDELRGLFHGMLNEIKGDFQQQIKPIQTVQSTIQKKKGVCPF